MTTQAISSYGVQLRLGDGVAKTPSVVNGATNAIPIVLSTSNPHNVVDVDVVTISGVVGNLGANGTWIASRIDANHVTLRGSVGTGTYVSGGLCTQNDSYASIAEITNLTDYGVQATLVDASAHDGNLWVSRVPTMLRGNTVQLSLNLVPAHPTHNPTTGLEFLLLTRTRRSFLLVFPDSAKTAWFFKGFVVGHKVGLPVAGLVTAQTTIELIDVPLLAAA